MPESKIKCVGIVVKPHQSEALATAAELIDWLKLRDITIAAKSHVSASDADPVASEVLRNEADLIIVLGGDGTMISTARLLGDSEVPVLGINYGSLGYLTEFRIEEMVSSLEEILAGNYTIDPRVTLTAEHWRDGKKQADARALNDVVINKAALARIIEIEVLLSGLYVNSFRADGLIVSTPTGSTAYNLSAGGPIVYPSMNAVVVTPICPFTLTNRPIVVPDDAEIKLILKDENEGVVLTIDGQVGYQMQSGDEVTIRKSRTGFNLVQPQNRNYFDVLRNKLKWGR